MSAATRAARSDRFWTTATTAKLTVGFILALAAPGIAACAEILTRRWPTGGTR